MFTTHGLTGLGRAILAALFTLLAVVPAAWAQDEEQSEPRSALPAIGYTDSPLIPGTPWRVHDINRPRPLVVTVAPAQTAQPAPQDAIVLFDGKDLSHWRSPGDTPGDLLAAEWKIEDGNMVVAPDTGSLQTAETFGDCQIHVEWSAPTPPEDSSQARGNSGVIIMGKYEIQVLDSYNNLTYADGQASSVYGQYPPLVNVTRPPGEWNVYDIVFRAPKFDGKKLIKPAYVTVFHNGVLVHYNRKLLGGVRHKELASYEPHSPAGPIVLQDHGNATRFRNIWVRPLDLE